ncbi:MAG: DUF4982 domain-containing protein [Bacteroides sp.]|nr:DUF4982 domain-containing protein [Roseburia sp.]MCM1346327.1 DUF4982 domain-containing protein [Bacteroides sp.]MCM1420916.1 DUF4982 domain-containing protein [Bacteroides sp.]
MKKLTLSALMLVMALAVFAGPRKQLFNSDWTFMLADIPDAKNVDYDMRSAANLWRQVTLPHDWSVEFKFDKDSPSGNDGGYLPTGTGWYRKTLNIAKVDASKKIQLYFEGAYMSSDVYVNGEKAGTNAYGYSSFFVDITPYIKAGKNIIAVRVDNSRQKNCRWYSGSGIYRNVWLMETDKAHVADWGVQITTPDLTTAVVKTTVVNEDDATRSLDVKTTVAGNTQTTAVTLKAGESMVVDHTFNVPDAKVWSPETPNLYNADIVVAENGKTIDSMVERFGFRTIGWSATDGFRLNGKPVLLNGSCVHHDNGILGAAAYDRAEYKRVELLKDAGFNAVRTSHNIPSETFLRACDEIGLLVIDEAFDGWRDKKNDHDYHELFDANWQADLDVMLYRDRNHPSIICWSIGNEVIERDKIEVVTTAHKLASRCRLVDPTRPVTSALACWGMLWETYDPLAAEHDIVGYNYMIHESEKDHERVPERVMWQTESYPNDAWSNFRKAKDHSYIVGDFVWTGMDYIGESGIGRWYYEGDVEGEHYHRPLYPWHASYCGDIDLTGLRKPISHYRSMLWNEDGEQLYIAVKEPDGYKGKIKTTLWGTWPTFESWNWPGHEGKNIDVEVYSHYPVVRLYLDDKLVGEKSVEQMKAVFTMPYTPGTLRVEGINNGSVAETKTLKTAGETADIRVVADRTAIAADGQDLSFVVIEILDAEGNVIPVADNALTVTVSGTAVLQALGNGDIKDEDAYFDNTHHVWNGRALAVVRSNGKRGKAVVKVKADGINGKSVVKTVNISTK